MALAVVAVRALLFGQLPKRAFVALWALVALRLLVPLWVPSPTSVYNALPDGLVESVVPAAVEVGVGGEADGVADLLPTAGDESLESGLAPSSDAVATPTGADASRSSESGGSAGTVAVADDAVHGGARVQCGRRVHRPCRLGRCGAGSPRIGLRGPSRRGAPVWLGCGGLGVGGGRGLVCGRISRGVSAGPWQVARLHAGREPVRLRVARRPSSAAAPPARGCVVGCRCAACPRNRPPRHRRPKLV